MIGDAKSVMDKELLRKVRDKSIHSKTEIFPFVSFYSSKYFKIKACLRAFKTSKNLFSYSVFLVFIKLKVPVLNFVVYTLMRAATIGHILIS